MTREIVVISGKGGTGKTSIVGSLAYLFKNSIIVDCDVDAADLHLILKGDTSSANNFIGGRKAEIIPEICNECGLCTEYCRFEAIMEQKTTLKNNLIQFAIDEYVCEGCGVCALFCPMQAIKMKDNISGEWFLTETKYGPLLHARLGIAQANSGKLVSLLRKKAQELAAGNNNEQIIIDGPPGIGCPVIASLTGTNYALIITEPTLSAIHDMERLLELTRHFGIKTGICINKSDINKNLAARIEHIATGKGLKVLARIPYDSTFTQAQIKGMPYMEYSRNGISKHIERLWKNLKEEIALLKNITKKNIKFL